jgi:hypothetical protein
MSEVSPVGWAWSETHYLEAWEPYLSWDVNDRPFERFLTPTLCAEGAD